MKTKENEFLLFSGSSHPTLAKEIANQMNVPLGNLHLERFPDGEIFVQILENVRGKRAFILQSVALDPNLYLMELLIIMDALKRASAKEIIVILPYFGYCRQDRKDKPRVPITAKLVANLLTGAGATRVLTVDLHAGQLQGFFDIPVDHIQCQRILTDAFQHMNLQDSVVVAPDIGSVKIARTFAQLLGVELAIIDKQRTNSQHVEMTLIGHVKGKNVLIADDMCSTGGTLATAANLCKEKGGKTIVAAVTHGLLVGHAIDHIETSAVESVLMTNSIPYTDRLIGTKKLMTVSIAPLVAKAMWSILNDESVSSL